jgi:RimJ/RimL family protein N-acetyltransferase
MSSLIFDVDEVYEFLHTNGVPVTYSAGMQAIGRVIGDQLVGGILYEGYSTNNIFMHVAGIDGRWINKEILKAAFGYPFLQLPCKRVSAWVEDSNEKSKRLTEHIGFKREALLSGAARDGGDVIIYRMWKEECRFI